MLKRKPKVYFSVPVTYDWGTFKTFVKQYSQHFECVYWERGTRYNEAELFADIDAIVILTPSNNWSRQIVSLPSGVQKELKGCVADDIPVYLAYKPAYYDIPLIYNINTEPLEVDEFLTGVAGTANDIVHELCTDFHNSLPKLLPGIPNVVTTKYNPITFELVMDRRLLLL